MLATLTLNPCIDKSLYFSNFVTGGTNRVRKTRLDPAGKGINVAIAYKNLGGDVSCTGFNYDEGGHLIVQLLEKSGIAHDFVNVTGKLRENLKIFDQSQNIVTEINEQGYPVSEDHISELFKKMTALKGRVSIISMCGSVPEGVPDSIYAQLIKLMKSLSIQCVLDAEKNLLLKGSLEKPYLIKPNLYELESAFGLRLKSKRETLAAARKFIDMGVEVVAVSLGENGALIVSETEAYESSALQITVKGPAGAGDSMIAGFCKAMEEGLAIDEMLCYGMAAAAASCMNEGTLLCHKNDFLSLLDKVEVRKIKE